MLESAGDTEGAKAMRQKATAADKELKGYCNKEGLTYRSDRAQVYGYSANKTVDNSAVSGIISSKIEIGKSLSAAAKNYPVKLLDSNGHTKLAENQTILGKTFAGKETKSEIRDRFRLERDYEISADEWKKVSGNAKIIENGKEVNVELHWYEANGEVVEMKVKRYLDES